MEWIELARFAFFLAIFVFTLVLLRQILLYALLALASLVRGCISWIFRPRKAKQGR